MFKTFFNSWKMLMVVCWIVGIFSTGNFKTFMWALPAGYAVGIIVTEFFMKRDEDDEEISFKAFGIKGKGKPVKVFDSRSDNMPPELKETMDKLMKIMKESGQLPDNKKCSDPHCPACHGFGDEEKND